MALWMKAVQGMTDGTASVPILIAALFSNDVCVYSGSPRLARARQPLALVLVPVALLAVTAMVRRAVGLL